MSLEHTPYDDRWLDEDGYPSDAALAEIRQWPVDRAAELMLAIRQIWRYADMGYSRYIGNELHLSTAGWSGNESIIQALMGNRALWMIHWRSSARGGHHIFHIPGLDETTQDSHMQDILEQIDRDGDEMKQISHMLNNGDPDEVSAAENRLATLIKRLSGLQARLSASQQGK